MYQRGSSCCKFCAEAVTPGKVCSACHAPVCRRHRSHVASPTAPFGKAYYCLPRCDTGARPSTSPAASSSSLQGDRRSIPASPETYAAFGPCGGDPLPLVPEAENGTLTVFFANGAPCVLRDSLEEVRSLTRAYVDRELRRGDCVEFASAVDGSGREGVRRGVVAGAVSGSLVVLERRTANPSSSVGSAYAATCVPPQQLHSIKYLPLGRCRHCGCLIPLDEARWHVEKVHTRDQGSGTLVDEKRGLVVGNVALMLNLRPVQELGAGAQGRVLLCARPKGIEIAPDIDSPHYVVKEIRCKSPEESGARYQQAVRLMSLRHPHIVRYLAVQRTADGQFVRLVMPYLQEKDLLYAIRNARSPFSEYWICSVTLQLAGALQYLHGHAPPILHGDLKPENVMMFSRMEQVLLMDFDTSVELSRSGTVRVAAGTAEWMAPETANAGRCTVKSDVWSLGLIAFVLAALPEFPVLDDGAGGYVLLNNAAWVPDKLKQRVRQEIIKKGYSSALANLVADMMHVDEAARPTAQAVVEQLPAVMEAVLLRSSSAV